MHLRRRVLVTASVALATAVTGMGLSEVQGQGTPPTSVTTTNAVIDWNENAGQAAVAACFLGGYGPQESRMYAMMHVAAHDALSAIAPRENARLFDLLNMSLTAQLLRRFFHTDKMGSSPGRPRALRRLRVLAGARDRSRGGDWRTRGALLRR